MNTSFWKAGHPPTLFAAFLYFDLSFMVWYLLGPLAIQIAADLHLTTQQRELLEQFEATFAGEGARRHSPKSSTFLDGVKGFWDRMVS